MVSLNRNIALFGGTFDPVHRGHIAVARAALNDLRFQLARVYFVPADLPPHKQGQTMTPYAHRYAMLELALAEAKEPRCLLSPLEARATESEPPNYSIHTVRRLKAQLDSESVAGPFKHALYFIIGIDAFLDIASWREPEALLTECKFIIAGRPGYSLVDASDALPEALRNSPDPNFFARFVREHLFLLPSVAEEVSSTQIRIAVQQGRPLERYVTSPVARYIGQHGLYR